METNDGTQVVQSEPIAQAATQTIEKIVEKPVEKILYPEDYVKELRNEAANNRIKAKEAETKLMETKADYEALQARHAALIDSKKKELVDSLGIAEEKKDAYLKMELDALELIAKDFNKKITNSLGAQSMTTTEVLPSTWQEFESLPTDKQIELYEMHGAEIDKLMMNK